MAVLVIILVVCNILMLTALVAAICYACSGDSKKKIELKNTNKNLLNTSGLICKNLCEFLSKKTIKYGGKVFNVTGLKTQDNGTIDVFLTDKLGFTKLVNINDLVVIEKETN